MHSSPGFLFVCITINAKCPGRSDQGQSLPIALHQSNNIDMQYKSDYLHSRSGKCHSTRCLSTQHRLHFCRQNILGLSGSFGYKSLESRRLNSTSAMLIHQNPFHRFRLNSGLRTEVKSWSNSNQQQNGVDHDWGFIQHPAFLTAKPDHKSGCTLPLREITRTGTKFITESESSAFNRFTDVRGSTYE